MEAEGEMRQLLSPSLPERPACHHLCLDGLRLPPTAVMLSPGLAAKGNSHKRVLPSAAQWPVSA